jgi:hypothetical protein
VSPSHLTLVCRTLLWLRLSPARSPSSVRCKSLYLAPSPNPPSGIFLSPPCRHGTVFTVVSSTMSSTCKPPAPPPLAPHDQVILPRSESALVSPPRKAGRALAIPSVPSSWPSIQSSNPYYDRYGLEETSVLCACFVSRHSSSATSDHPLISDLDHFAVSVPQHPKGHASRHSDTNSRLLRGLRSTSNAPPFDRRRYRSVTAATIKNEVSCRPGLIWAPTLHLVLHDRVEGHLR